MTELFFLVLFVPLSVLIAASVSASKKDRAFLSFVVVCAWVLLGSFVAMINIWIPFNTGGDDFRYYLLAESYEFSFTDVFDLKRFTGLMEQPGYPWLLSILGSILGHELLIYKWFNLFFFILLSLTWYRIGYRLESASFGRRLAVLILLLTPLWFYFLFLLKDMAIILLQSTALLAVIEIRQSSRLVSVSKFLSATFLLLLFRTPLVIQNLSVLMGTLVFRNFGARTWQKGLFSIVLGILALILSVPLVTNSSFLAYLGIHTEHRVIGSEAMLENVSLYREAARANKVLFPLIYLFSETAGLNPQTWSEMDSGWLRGVLALPWIFLIVPFFLLGGRYLFKPLNHAHHGRGFIKMLRHSRLVGSPWGAVFLFVSSSFAISWLVGDTTRYRIPDMPMIAAIALLSWTHSSPSWRRQVLFIWITSTVVLFSLYYISRI